MSNPRPSFRLIVFSLFTISGFSGLIYESIWSHYLKLMLGHAAYAQTLVLAIFMGGMAGGAWLMSRRSKSWRNPLRAYAIVEGVIGLFGLVFHVVFVAVVDGLYLNLIPLLDSPVTINALRWTVAALLILPQSILLGTTFPLMSTGIIRAQPKLDGSTLALLYFTNSIGAAAGVLVSGFVLIRWVGLPGTIAVAAVLNLLLAAVMWVLSAQRNDPPLTASNAQGSTPRSRIRLVALAAFLTGLASFCYEIGWVRMLSLVLGSTNQAFELMLSAFITGLALGGLAIKRAIDRLENPLRFAGGIQIMMAIFAIATLPLYAFTFDVMAYLLANVDKNEDGYALFNLSSHAIAMAIMLPATIMAGMTLPLFTHALIKDGQGEASIGRVYAANTVGAIAGVLLAVHVVLPMAGVKWLIGLGAIVDVALGVALITLAAPIVRRAVLVGAVPLAVIAFALFTAGMQFDPLRTSSGVYRHGVSTLPEGTEFLFHKDGKTATIDLYRRLDGGIAIVTNGKPDATINPKDAAPTADEATMVLAAAVPLALRPQARRVANIGLGSGLTTHTLLGADRLERVDTVEIEKAMVEAARGFGEQVERAFTDSRSRIHIEDAKTFFATHQQRYDIIVSEPSNPWVSGVASLFTDEFYAHVDHYLEDDGILVQWLQLYETNFALLSSVFRALAQNYPRFSVFNTDNANILIIAAKGGDLATMDDWIFASPQMRADLARVDIHDIGDIDARRIGDETSILALLGVIDAPANSDYYPFLAQHAPKARFLSQTAVDLTWMHLAPIPVLEMLSHRAPPHIRAASTPSYFSPFDFRTSAADMVSEIQLPGSTDLADNVKLGLRFLMEQVANCDAELADPKLVRDGLRGLANTVNPYLPPEVLTPMWQALDGTACGNRLDEKTRAWLTLHGAVAQRDAARMLRTASLILDTWPDEMAKTDLDYLLTAGLTAYHAQGQSAAALAWLDNYAQRYPQEPPPLFLRMLIAMAQPGTTQR